MSYYRLKLGATLSLNVEKERDIIKQLESLKKRHKLGEFISNCIRLTFEHPELLKEQGMSLEKYGLVDNRVAFFNAVKTEVNQLRHKIDSIYNLALEMHTLVLFNKKLNLEERTKNILSAQFILQRQTDDICNLLGVETLNSVYASEKLFEINKNVEDTLEFIIKYYDGIVDEIKSSVSGLDEQDRKLLDLKKKLDELESNKYLNSESKEIQEEAVKKASETSEGKQSEDEVRDEDEIEGFDISDNADLVGLESFFGGQF